MSYCFYYIFINVFFKQNHIKLTMLVYKLNYELL